METIKPISFYFMRHGETEFNKKRIAMGSIDCGLNANEIQQA